MILIKKTFRIIKKTQKSLRRRYWTWRVRNSCAKVEGLLVANYRSVATPTTFLGHNVHFNGLEIQGGGTVRIGNNFHSGKDCLLITQNHNFDSGKALPYDETYTYKDIVIGDNVWLGSRVIILGGVTIGEGAIIQAGSCVVKDIPALSIAGGHPAKVFSKRDPEHYFELKRLKKFH